MRTSAIQDLYLQKPLSTIAIVCLISILPWISITDFATKGEPREAAVAVSMIEDGDWILPTVYANEFAYKPPMTHWLMAIASLPQGHVSEFTARLPSTLAYVVLLLFVLLFFGKRGRFQEAFIATIILLTCVEIHRAGMTARVDMVLTMFIVTALIQLYRWEELMELKGLPVIIPILLSGAILTKGPVGVILPLFIFTVYLLTLRKYSFLKLFKSILYIGIASLFLPFLWYLAAWNKGGDEFLQVMMAENFGRFFHLSQEQISYHLGHENGAWYNLVTLIAGFMPWTLLLFFSLFGLRRGPERRPLKQRLKEGWHALCSMEKVRLFSLIAVCCTLLFFSIPSSKRSVYLMPAYPFLAIFIAQYIIYITEYHSTVTRLFAGFMATIMTLALSVTLLTMTGVMDLNSLAAHYTTNAKLLATVGTISRSFTPSVTTVLILIVMLLSLLITLYQLRKKISIKILYSVLFLSFCLNLFIDGVVMVQIKNEGSARPFAEEITRDFPLDKENVFVMNDLKQYSNLYGLNFYMKNSFHNFQEEQPQSGYFLSTEDDLPKVMEAYRTSYDFTPLKSSDRIVADCKRKIVLSRFQRKE